MKVTEAAKRYAKAIFVVTKQKGVHQRALAEINTLSTAITSDAAAMNFFSNPMVSAEKKAQVIREVVAGGKILEEVSNSLMLLADKNRMVELSGVAVELQNLIDGEDGVTRGVVCSAQPLSADAKSEIEQKINKVLNKKISLTYEQDAKLLGGVVAQVGGWTFDDSIDTHLKKLNEELNRRAN